MSTFTLAISCLITSNLPWFMDLPNTPGSYAILFFTASDFTCITSHIHNCALFTLWLSLFSLSGVISPVFSRSLLGTYHLGSSSFSAIYFFPFHIVHGVLKARMGSQLPLGRWICSKQTLFCFMVVLLLWLCNVHNCKLETQNKQNSWLSSLTSKVTSFTL